MSNHTNSNAVSTLNHLIQTLKDGHLGFQAAAQDVKSPDLRATLSEYSLQRSRFAGELQALAHSLGESNPEDSGSVSAALHRGWIDMIAALTNKDDHSVLAECERGEDSAVAEFRTAIADEELPRNVLDTISQQYSAIRAAHDNVRDLRDALASAPR